MLAILLVILKVTSAELGDFNNQVASGLISGLKFPQGSESCISFHARILYHIKPCNYLDLLDFKTVLKCLESIPISLSPIPEELIKCEKQLQTDSIRLNNTLPIFKNPLTYNLTVNSNVVLKNVDITKDLIDIQMFLKDSLDFEAAAALGEVARRMFIRESIEKEIDELFKGFVAGIGLTDDAYKCLKDPKSVLKQLKAAFKLLDRNNLRRFVTGLRGIHNALSKLTKELKACDQKFSSDVKRIEEALVILRYPYYYKIVIGKDIMLNGVSIERDLRNAARAFEEEYYYDFGYDIGFLISKFEPAK